MAGNCVEGTESQFLSDSTKTELAGRRVGLHVCYRLKDVVLQIAILLKASNAAFSENTLA